MNGARHDIYIVPGFPGDDARCYVRPGAFAISPCTCGIRFRNLAGTPVTITFLDPHPFALPSFSLTHLESRTVFVNWAVASPGVYRYRAALGHDIFAKGNSDPTIIIDL